MRVLLVEDDGLQAFVAQDALEGGGYQVIGPARNFDEAIAFAEEYLPELAVLDVNLQGDELTGVDVARSLNDTRPVAALYLTGQERLALAGAEYAMGVIGKPVAPRDLVKAVDFVAGRSGERPHCLRLFDRRPGARRNADSSGELELN
jgi:two-component system, response regulator PdtaR